MTAEAVRVPGVLWHVTLTLAGEATPPQRLHDNLQALCDLDPCNMAARYQPDAVELHFWDEGTDVAEVAHAALSLWGESRAELSLPSWSLVGLEILDRARLQERQLHAVPVIKPGAVVRLY